MQLGGDLEQVPRAKDPDHPSRQMTFMTFVGTAEQHECRAWRHEEHRTPHGAETQENRIATARIRRALHR